MHTKAGVTPLQQATVGVPVHCAGEFVFSRVWTCTWKTAKVVNEFKQKRTVLKLIIKYAMS